MHGTMEPGGSMYFDAQALQDQEEADLLREEEAQQRELQERLATEFDDLIDDDDSDSTGVTSSGDMDDTHDMTADSAMQPEENKNERGSEQPPPPNPWPPQDPNQPGGSPSQEHGQPGHHQEGPGYHQYPEAYGMHNQNMFYNYQGDPHMNYENPENHGQMGEWDQQQSPFGPIGGEYGHKDHYPEYQGQHMAPIHEDYPYQENYEIPPQFINGPGYYGDGYYADGYHGYGAGDGHFMGSQDNAFSPHHEFRQSESYPDQYGEFQDKNSPHRPPFSPKNYDGSPHANVPKSPKDLENYKVQYVQKTQGEGNSETGHLTESDTNDNSQRSEPDQRQFVEQGGAPDTRQLAQLQILYKARGRQLDEMTKNYDNMKEETSREMRIMKHKMAQLEGEKEGLSSSLKQTQSLLQQSQEENSQNQVKISNLSSQIETLNSAREEMSKKLEDADSTIADLNQQLIDLTKTDCISRARDRQDTILHSIQQKHEKEVYHLKEKLDEANKRLEDKRDEVESLRQQVSTVIKSSETSNMDRADAINRLTRSLDESQQRCRELLEKGSPETVNRLKVQLVQAEAAKSISDDLCQALQEEMNDLKEQLSMYESAASFGIHPTSGSHGGSRSASPVDGCQSDSFLQLNVKGNANDSKIPRFDTSGRQTPPTKDDKCLKVELDKCIQNYRQKRLQVRKLQEENMAAKKELAEFKCKLESADLALGQQKDRTEFLETTVADYKKGEGQKTLLEERLERDVKKLEAQKADLKSEVEDLRMRLDEFANNEERLTVMNNELNSELSQVMRNFECEKQDSNDRYQATLQQHYENAKDRIRDELVNNFNDERRKLIESYQSQVEEARHKLGETVKELLGVKDMYVTVCREKDSVEEQTKKACREENDKQMEELKVQLSKEKEEELQKLRLSLMETNQVTMATAKDKWWKEKEEEMKREIEAQVAMAKVEWFEEHKKEKQSAVESAAKNAEREWKIKLETEVESRLEMRLKEAEELWLETQKSHVDGTVEKQLKVEKEKLQNRYQNDLKGEEIRWAKEAEQRQELAIQRALSKAKVEWLKSRKEGELTMREEVETSLLKRHKISLDQEVTQAVHAAREKWLQEKQAEIAELMENNKNMMDSSLQEKLDERARRLEQEVEKLKRRRDHLERELKIQREAAEEEKETLIKLKDIEVDSLKSRRDKLEQDFTSMKKSWLQEKQELIDGHLVALQKKETELKNLRQLCNRLEIECKSLQVEKEGLESEYETLKLRREDLEREFRSSKESWLLEKEDLIRTKDTERRKAVNEVEDQNEKSRKQLVNEHSEMLEKALRAAKEQFEREKTELLAVHEEDVTRLREHERKSLESFVESDADKSIIREMESKFSWERNEVEKIWQKKLVEAQARYEKECEELTRHFHETVEQLRDRFEKDQKETESSYQQKLQALIDEGKKERENVERGWEKKLEWTREAYEKEKQILHASHREDMKRAVEQVKKEKDSENMSIRQEWQTQQSKLLQELESREQMIHDADKHIEAEIERLRKDLENEHDERLRTELGNLRVRFETEFSRTVDSSTSERHRLQAELERSAKQLLDLEQKYEKVIMTYQEKLNKATLTFEKSEKTYQQKMEDMKNNLETEYNDIIDSCEREKNDFATKLELCQEQLHRVRNEREEIEAVHSKCEKRQAELRDRLRKVEKQIIDGENQKKQDLEQLKKSLESRHQVVVEAMKAKVIEVRKHHTVAMETLKRQHTLEKQDLTKRTLQDVTNKISQTENIGNVEKTAMEEMRTYYLNTVNKIRDDVMKHVNETNVRAAKTVRTELTKERQSTAKHLKQYYLQCFRQLLIQNNENMNSDAKVLAMEKALDLAPIKGLNGSRCATPQPSAFSPVTELKTPSSYSPESRSRDTSTKSFNQSDNTSIKADASTNTSSDSPNQKYWDSEKNRNVTRSSEKYPSRNISPSRKSDAVKISHISGRGHSEVSLSGVHELCLSQPNSIEKSYGRKSPDFDNTQPIRDENTSGYRSMSYVSRSPESDRSHMLRDGQRSPKSLPSSVLNSAKNSRQEVTPKDLRNNSYKYKSLRNSGKTNNSTSMNFNSYLSEGLNSQLFDGSIDLSEVGLNKIPMQPRPYNPPAERLISDESESKSSSTCSTPNYELNRVGNRSESSVQSRQHSTKKSQDSMDSTPRRPLKSGRIRTTEKSTSKKLLNGSNSGTPKLLKPVAMCTRHTQVPSPTPFRDVKYS